MGRSKLFACFFKKATHGSVGVQKIFYAILIALILKIMASVYHNQHSVEHLEYVNIPGIF